MNAISMRLTPRVPAGSNSLAARAAQGLADGAEPTRRGILGALAGVPVVATFGTVALAPARASCVDWERALAGYKAARAKFSIASQAQSDAEERYFAAKKAIPKVQHGLTIRRGETVEGAVARTREEVAAYKRADEAASLAAGVPVASALNDAACEADDEALMLMICTPAPNLLAVIEKMKIIEDNGLGGVESHWAVADLERLAAEGR